MDSILGYLLLSNKNFKLGFFRGFGYVMFDDPATAAKALKTEVHEYDGKKFDVKVALTKIESLSTLKSEKHRKLYITGIPLRMTKGDLENHFIQFGEITDIRILKQEDSSRHKLFGFLTFAEKSGADAALKFGDHHWIRNFATKVILFEKIFAITHKK